MTPGRRLSLTKPSMAGAMRSRRVADMPTSSALAVCILERVCMGLMLCGPAGAQAAQRTAQLLVFAEGAGFFFCGLLFRGIVRRLVRCGERGVEAVAHGTGGNAHRAPRGAP